MNLFRGTPFASMFEVELYLWAEAHLPVAIPHVDAAWNDGDRARGLIGHVLCRVVERFPQYLYDLALYAPADLMPFAEMAGLGKPSHLAAAEWVRQLADAESFCRQQPLTDGDWALLMTLCPTVQPTVVAPLSAVRKPRRPASMFHHV